MITRRLFAALALTAVVATACGTSDSADPAVRADGTVDLSQVTLHIGDQKGIGLQALLDAAGELKSVPYKIEWSQYTSGPPLLEAINSGAVDIGGVGNAPPVFAAAAKSAIRIVSAYRAGIAGQAIVVPKDSPLHGPNDLRGRKIAVTKGSSAHYHLLSVLTKNGLSIKDVEPQYLQPADALAALTTGRVDAWAIWDPYTAQAQHQADVRVLVDGNGYVEPDAFYVAGTKALDSKSRSAALRDLLARIHRAHTWVNEHPDQWAQTYAQFSGLPLEVTTVAVKRGLYQDHSLDPAAIDAEQRVADAFAEAKLIPHKVTIVDFVDTRFNDLFPAP
ncbi:ABC transporter substrate-binding protein [Nocardia transvalensis]|uniref:ABC transporter substrate-binding protein n=1 Tax=Nocardia transvalensis TaxID=37333 RepID=UPI001893F85B|nr:ABC transporter substrate-binding protein [Nocardia transvalensis]MBF6333258.1 ABC transporter substrate-binding protein [Nocardia transvalensis]